MNETARARRRGTLFLAVVLVGLWAAWSGPLSLHHPLLAAFGAVSIFLVVYLCRRMGIVDENMTPLHLTGRTLVYVPWLGREVIRSCYRVLQRALASGGPEIQPGVLRVETSQHTELGLVSHANSITLTPGTLSLDCDLGEETDGVPRVTVYHLSERGAAGLEGGAMDEWVTWVVDGKDDP